VSRVVNRGVSRAAALVAGLALAAGAAAGAERLSTRGVRLSPAQVVAGAPFERAVEAGGAEVLSVHATLRPASSNVVYARDRDGFWTPWSGDPAELPPSAARREGALLVFKLFDAPPEGMTWPLTVTLAYRTPEGLAYGWFDVLPGAAP
jgi:hypothetical protein